MIRFLESFEMAFQTTVFLSVLAVALSIIAHQSDPEIIPSLLAQGVDAFHTVNKNINYYYNEYLSDTAKSLGLDSLWPNKDSSSKNTREEGTKYVKNKPMKGSKNQEIVLTKEELKEYDGEENSKGIYVAILGSVFDVESGKKHYGPGGGYHFFAGKDGSRAFITGEFNDAGLIDDVSGLTPKDLKALHEWVKFYHKDYKYVGKLVGRFYDSDGKRTLEMKELQKTVKNFEREEEKTKEQNKTYPPCNVEWNKERGSRVWCTTKSGGVVRSWAGVPRQLFEGSGKKSRCTCVEPQMAISDPRLAEYEGCPPGSDSCWVTPQSLETMSEARQLLALDFEVFGRVQGVFFRKYTVQTGKKLGLRGWCMNTHHDSVLGQMEGETPAIEEMKKWLSTVGSPSSKIDKAEFRNERKIEKYSFDGFLVHH